MVKPSASVPGASGHDEPQRRREVVDTVFDDPGIHGADHVTVTDAEALFEAGWELVDVDLDALAVTPLARALTLQPREVAIVNELALALEAAGSPAEAGRLYRENAWAVEGPADRAGAGGRRPRRAARPGDRDRTGDRRPGPARGGTLANARVARSEGPAAPVEHLRGVLPSVLTSQDAAEGVRSFIERREARFTGR